MTKTLTASEALYGFIAWLTCRDEQTVMSAQDDSAPVADLVERFCKENSLAEPRDGWENNIVIPAEESRGIAS